LIFFLDSHNQISSSSTDAVWMVDITRSVYYRRGISLDTPFGVGWVEVPNTKMISISTGSMSISLQPAIIDPPLEGYLPLTNLWGSYGRGHREAVVQKFGALCIISGKIAGGLWTRIGQVQHACVPSQDLILSLNNGDGATNVQVTTRGDILYVGGSAEYDWLSLDGLVYDAMSQSSTKIDPLNGWLSMPANQRSAVAAMTPSGICYLSGSLQSGRSSVIGNIMSACIPTTPKVFHIASASGFSRLNITTSGQLILDNFNDSLPTNQRWISFDGVTFLPSATTPLRLDNLWSSSVDSLATLEKVGKLCILGGSVSGTIVQGNTIANVPSFCRPQEILTFNAIIGKLPARVDILPSGQVVLQSTKCPAISTDISLNGIMYHPRGVRSPSLTDIAKQDPVPPMQALLTLQGGWMTNTNGYRGPIAEITDDGICLLSGRIVGGKAGKVAEIPSFCTPDAMASFGVLAEGKRVVRLDIGVDGMITLEATDPVPEWISLDQIIFKPEYTINLAKGNSWSDFGSDSRGSFAVSSIVRASNLCIAGGVVKANAVLTDPIVATMPLNCRSSKTLMFLLKTASGSTTAVMYPSGELQVFGKFPAQFWISLSGVVFDPQPMSPLDLEGGWGALDTNELASPSISIEAGWCVLSGIIAGGGWGPVATLPVGCRPTGKLSFQVASNGTISQLDLLESGTLQLVSLVPPTGILSLDGIVFDPAVDSDIVKAYSAAQANLDTSIGDSSVQLSNDGYLQISSSTVFNFDGNFTVELWFYAQDGQRSPLIVRQSGRNSFGLFWEGPGNALSVFDASLHFSNKNDFELNRWYHVALVEDTALNVLELYIDGVLDFRTSLEIHDPCNTGASSQEICEKLDHCHYDSTARSCSADMGAYLDDLFIGGTRPGLTFIGQLADIRLWNVRKHEADIQATKNQRVAAWEVGLVSNWQFKSADELTVDLTMNAPIASIPGGMVEFVRGGPGLAAAPLTGGAAPTSTSIRTTHGRVRFAHTSRIHFNNSDPMTLEFWFLAETASNQSSWMVLKNGDYGIQWHGPASPLSFFDGNFHDSSARTFKVGVWYHIALVDAGGDNGFIQLFIDGILDKIEPRTPLRTAYLPLSIGGVEGVFFDGRITDVRVWRVPRSSGQIRSVMYHRLRGSEPGLGGYFRFNSDASIITDCSDSTNEGQVQGIVEWSTKAPALRDPLPSNSIPASAELVISGTNLTAQSVGSGLASVVMLSNARAGLLFDGNSRVTLPRASTFTLNSFSFLFTIKSTENDGTILSFWSSTGNFITFAITMPSGLKLRCGEFGNRVMTTGINVNDGSWHSIGITVDRDQNYLRVYKDGVKAFEESIAGSRLPLMEGMGSLVLGQSQKCETGCFDANQGFRGGLRHVSFWQRALSDQEVRDRAITPVFDVTSVTNLAFWLRMDEGKGTGILDSSPNSMHAEQNPVRVEDRSYIPVNVVPSGLVANYEIDYTAILDDRSLAGVAGPLKDIGALCFMPADYQFDNVWRTVLRSKAATGFMISGSGRIVGRSYTVAMLIKLAHTADVVPLMKIRGYVDGIYIQNGMVRTQSEAGYPNMFPFDKWNRVIIVRQPLITTVYVNEVVAGTFTTVSNSLQVSANYPILFFNAGTTVGCAASTAGHTDTWFKSMYIFNRALSKLEVDAQIFGAMSNEPLSQTPAGRWLRLIDNAILPSSVVNTTTRTLSTGTFTRIRAVYNSGALTCPFDAMDMAVEGSLKGWQQCQGTGFSFELKKNSQPLIQQSLWNALPSNCDIPTSPTGDIFCNVSFTLTSDDWLTPSWYNRSHEASEEFNGQVVFDLFGWTDSPLQLAQARVAKFSSDSTTDPFANLLGTSVSGLVNVGALCSSPKPAKLVTDVLFKQAIQFLSGTGFKIPFAVDSVDESRYSIAMLVQIGSLKGEAPIFASSAGNGIYLNSNGLVLQPLNKFIGSFSLNEWHKLVITQSIDLASIFLDNALIGTFSQVRALDVSKTLQLFTADGLCSTSTTSTSTIGGFLRELQIFSRPITEGEVSNLFPNFVLNSESRKVFLLTANNYMKANLKDFPTKQFTMAFKLRTTAMTSSILSTWSQAGEELSITNPQSLTMTVTGVSLNTGFAVNNGYDVHIAFIVDKELSVFRVYINGTNVGRGVIDPTAFGTDMTIVFGQKQTCYGGCFDSLLGLIGRVHTIRAWTTILTEQDIQADAGRTIRLNPQQLKAKSSGVPTDMSLYLMWYPENVRASIADDQTGGGHFMNLGVASWMIDCPRNCSGRGTCETGGRCACEAGFSGDDCSSGCPNSCSLQGACIDGRCLCLPQYRGEDCSSPKDPAEDIISDQCMPLPIGQPMFCSMITHAVPITMQGDNLMVADNQAFDTYNHLSKYCANSQGRQVMKHAICGSFFLKCTDSGQAIGVCKSECQNYESMCNIQSSGCESDIFVADATGSCFTNYPLGYPGAFNETCSRNCLDHGNCVEGGLCACDEGYSGADCSQCEFQRLLPFFACSHTNQKFLDAYQCL
jgi:hypothetical protein